MSEPEPAGPRPPFAGNDPRSSTEAPMAPSHPDARELFPSAMPPATDDRRELQAWHQLDPRTILAFPFAQGAPILLLVIIAALAGGRLEGLLIRLGSTVGLFVLGGALHWFRFRYRLLEGRLETRSGLLSRHSKVIHVDRIRGVEIEAKLAHRLVGVCAVRIEHPGAASGSRGHDRDGRDRINAVSRAEGERLRVVLLHERAALVAGGPCGRAATEVSAAPGRVLLRMPPRWLLFAPFSLRLLLVGPVAIFGLFGSFGDAGVHPHRLVAGRTPAWAVLGVLVVPALIVTGVVAAAVAYWRWTVSAHGDDVVVTGGLLTRRTSAIERRRLRGVVLREPLAGRWAGAATLRVVLSGVTGSVRSALVPLGPRVELERFGRSFVAPCAVPLRRHPAGARRRRLRRALPPALIILVAAAIVTPWARLTGLGLAAGAVVAAGVGWWWARESYRTLGHALDERVLAMRHGVLVRHTETVLRGSPIGMRVRQSIFARRAGVASVDVALVSRGYSRISDVDADDIADLAVALLGPSFRPVVAASSSVSRLHTAPAG